MKITQLTTLKHKLQWLVLLAALLGMSQGVWGWNDPSCAIFGIKVWNGSSNSYFHLGNVNFTAEGYPGGSYSSGSDMGSLGSGVTFYCQVQVWVNNQSDNYTSGKVYYKIDSGSESNKSITKSSQNYNNWWNNNWQRYDGGEFTLTNSGLSYGSHTLYLKIVQPWNNSACMPTCETYYSLTFTVPEPTYDWSANKTLYFDHTNTKNLWSGSSLYMRIGRGNYCSAYVMTKVNGTANLYKYKLTSAWNNYNAFGVGNNASWTDNNNDIYKTCTGDSYEVSHHTNFVKTSVTTDYTIISSATRTYGSDSKNSCTYFYDNTTYASKKQWRATISVPSNGTISASYKDENNNNQSFSSTSSTKYKDVLPTCILTLSATPSSGYELDKFTITDGSSGTRDKASGDTIIVRSNTTIAATFKVSCAVPTAYTLDVKTGSPSNICADGDYGTASTTLTLANSQTGYTYQLYDSSDNTVGDPQAGSTNNPLDFSVSAAGTYHVVAYLTGTPTCTNTMTGAPEVTSSAVPTYTSITAGSRICQGSTLSLTVTGATNTTSYQWYKGSSTVGTNSNTYSKTMTSDDAATYKCNLINGACTKSTSNSVITYAAKPDTPSISGDDTQCENSTGKKYSVGSGGTPGATYTWSVSGTDWSITSGEFTNEATMTVGTANGTITLTPKLTTSGTTCTGTNATKNVSVDAASVAGSVSGSSQQVCLGDESTLSVKNYNGSIQWHTSTVSGFEPGPSTQIDGATSEKYYAPTNAVGTKYYKAVITNGVCNAATTAQAYVTVNRAYEYTDFTLSDNAQTYNGSARAVTVSEKSGAGNGAITIYYTGTGTTTYATSTTAPTNAGAYDITIYVAKSSTSPYYCEATGLEVGTLTINKANQSTLTISNTLTDFAYCSGVHTTLTTSGGSGSGAVTYTITSGSGNVDGSTLTATANGSITVTATKAASENYNATTSAGKTFNFTQNPPTAYDISADVTSICSGGGGTITLAYSQTGYNYLLYNNGTPLDEDIKAGTGSEIDFDVTSSGVYTAKGYYGTNRENCLTDMNESVVMTISTTPKLVRSAQVVTNYAPVTITSVSTDIETWTITGTSNAYVYDKTENAITFKGNSTDSPYTITARTHGGCENTTTVTVTDDTESCN